MPPDGLARRVKLQELAGHLAQLLFHTVANVAPRGSAQLVDFRSGALHTPVALHQVELFERQVEAILATVGDFHELAPLPGHLELANRNELSDSVLDMNHHVAGLEIAEVGAERVAVETAPSPSDPCATEHFGVGAEPQPLVGQAEAGGQVGTDDPASAGFQYGY